MRCWCLTSMTASGPGTKAPNRSSATPWTRRSTARSAICCRARPSRPVSCTTSPNGSTASGSSATTRPSGAPRTAAGSMSRSPAPRFTIPGRASGSAPARWCATSPKRSACSARRRRRPGSSRSPMRFSKPPRAAWIAKRPSGPSPRGCANCCPATRWWSACWSRNSTGSAAACWWATAGWPKAARRWSTPSTRSRPTPSKRARRSWSPTGAIWPTRSPTIAR